MAVGYTSGDPRKVDVPGDTMTGELALPATPPSGPAVAVTKSYVDTQVSAAANNASSSASGLYVPEARITIQDLLQNDPFYVAHRGGGAVYPEHTIAAWDAAVASGAIAIEVSGHLSKDGVLFAYHDTTLDRMTEGAFTGSFSEWSWAEIKQLAKVKTSGLLGPGWADQTIPTIDEVLQRYMGRVVIFLEAKSSASVVPMQNLLLKYKNAQKSVVWKNFFTNNSFPTMKSRGFYTWAYIDDETTMAEMDAVESLVDMWGVSITAPDAKFTEVLSRPVQKPVMSWPIWRRSERDRLVGFNVGGRHVQGIMSSEYAYLTRPGPFRTADAFGRGIKQPGQIGSVKESTTYALKFDTADGSCRIDALSGAGVVMGDMSNNASVGASGGYRIAFQLKYPSLPAATLHGGLFFCAANDSKHQFNDAANSVDGYRWLLRGNGDMQLYTYTAGVQAGTQLDTVNLGALTPDTWYSFQIDVLPAQIVVRSLTLAATRTIANTSRRGLYWGFHNGTIASQGTVPRYRSVTVSPV